VGRVSNIMIAHGMISQSKGAEGRRNPTVREGAEGRNPTVRGVQKAETRASGGCKRQKLERERGRKKAFTLPNGRVSAGGS